MLTDVVVSHARNQQTLESAQLPLASWVEHPIEFVCIEAANTIVNLLEVTKVLSVQIWFNCQLADQLTEQERPHLLFGRSFLRRVPLENGCCVSTLTRLDLLAGGEEPDSKQPLSSARFTPIAPTPPSSQSARVASVGGRPTHGMRLCFSAALGPSLLQNPGAEAGLLRPLAPITTQRAEESNAPAVVAQLLDLVFDKE